MLSNLLSQSLSCSWVVPHSTYNLNGWALPTQFQLIGAWYIAKICVCACICYIATYNNTAIAWKYSGFHGSSGKKKELKWAQLMGQSNLKLRGATHQSHSSMSVCCSLSSQIMAMIASGRVVTLICEHLCLLGRITNIPICQHTSNLWIGNKP